MGKKRKKRRSALNIKLDEDGEPKKKKEKEKVEGIDYKAFKTKLGKKYANYLVVGPLQPTGNWMLQEWKLMLKQSGSLAMVRARSIEEAFHIYHTTVTKYVFGGIHPLMELGFGMIKDFKPKFIHKADGRVWYYDTTTFVEKLRLMPEADGYKVAVPNCSIWWRGANLMPEDKKEMIRAKRKELGSTKIEKKPRKKRKNKKRKKRKKKTLEDLLEEAKGG